MSAPFILFGAYVVVGPLAWITMFVLLMLGRRRMMRLVRVRTPVLQTPPLVSILIPAKDEAAGIRSCIQSVLRQYYPRFKIIAIDDRSTDGTGAILDQLAAAHQQKLTALHVVPGSLPDGWLGKCHALDFGARHADGEWLLFVDSDVTLQPDAVMRAVSLCTSRRYDALSILTRLDCRGFWERLILPLAAGAWSVMHVISLTNVDSRTSNAVANGQFFLIRHSAYQAVGGHESVKDQITEDVEMMRLLKGRAFRTRLMLGSQLATTRMHATLRQMFHGWGRIYGGTNRRRPSRIIGAMLFLLICGFSVYPALLWGLISTTLRDDTRWLMASGSHLLLMTGYLALIYHWSGNRARYAWLFPIGGGVLLAMLAFALRTCRTGSVKWRGTHFQVPVHAGRNER